MKLVPTGSQTVGPFFAIGLDHLCSAQARANTPPVIVRGRLMDGNGAGVPDAVLEVWQADPQGRYAANPADRSAVPSGFARIATDEGGSFSFTTCRPGPVPFDATAAQAPHLVVLVFARGLLRHLITRMYFPDEPGNATDPILQSIEADRRATMIARRVASDAEVLEWNVVLQGEGETVFFAW